MSWTGTMTCEVVNETGYEITNVSAAHTWNDKPSEKSVPVLGSGESFAFKFECGAEGNDYWSVSFTDNRGRDYFRDQKQCNLEQDDYQSGSPVFINLLDPEQGFSIELPYSASCLDNPYQRR
jgi:hypothetical protein